ncbi:hypothetical protein HZ326_20153 [Fusarium oxysporum f. sp. albedinis]|nr:hypothetical protein HZ326_20153 [Fusarium oxysporum f. sp. albedinis]
MEKSRVNTGDAFQSPQTSKFNEPTFGSVTVAWAIRSPRSGRHYSRVRSSFLLSILCTHWRTSSVQVEPKLATLGLKLSTICHCTNQSVTHAGWPQSQTQW